MMNSRLTRAGDTAPTNSSPEAELTAATLDGAQSDSASALRTEEIEQLAYSYWQQRGCPDGSAEQDWLRAESDLRAQMELSAAQPSDTPKAFATGAGN